MNSMTPEQRQELMQLSEQAFGSPALMESLAQLDSNLQALRPGEDWGGSEQFEGGEGLGLGDGTGALQEVADLDALSEQLSQAYPGASMGDIVSSVRQVNDIIGRISIASTEQADGIADVNRAVGQMDSMTQQNAALVEQASAAAGALEEQARTLDRLVGRFKLGQDPVACLSLPRYGDR